MVGALPERRHPRGASMPPGATELPMRAKCCRATAFVGVPIDLPVQYPWMPGQAGQGTLGNRRAQVLRNRHPPALPPKPTASAPAPAFAPHK
jgi:hypothetical protein